MWRKENTLFFLLMITGFPVCHSSGGEPVVVGRSENRLQETLGAYSNDEKNTLLFQNQEQENPHRGQVPIEAGEYFQRSGKEMREKEAGNDGFHSERRARRQVQTTRSLLDSISQECDGITLRWNRPNIPFSLIFHNDNPEFSHYNIYRETNYFTSVAGLKPIASGKDHIELQNIATDKWTDKFPPTGTGLFYAVTVVDHKGKETKNDISKQITFYGIFEKTGVVPTRIVPGFLKGNVLHHSLAYNDLRNEYMVAFDLDVNKDGRPDQVYAMRLNGLGQIIDRRILNATVGMKTTEQGRPSVAYSPIKRQYLIAFQLSAPALFGGVSIIIGQRVSADRTDRHKNPYILLKATKDGKTHVPTMEPKLIYNSATGGFAMSAMIMTPLKSAFAVFIRANGQTSSITPLFKGEVFDSNVFMDTKRAQVYFIYQVAQWAATVTKGKHASINSYPYLILATKANATGGLLSMNDPTTVRNLVGFTNVKHANIAGYYHENNGWLTLFWNNEGNGRKIINSTNILGFPGIFLREENINSCPIRGNVENPASCFLPKNNGHILLWEQGSAIGGFLVKDDTFKPVLGKQEQPQIIYNRRDQRAFVVWKQIDGGNVVLYVRNVHPGSHVVCRVSCKSNETCAMKDVCAPKNRGAFMNLPSCAKAKGGCSHTCSNDVNGRKCTCPWSHSLALDGMKCLTKGEKPDVALLYSSKESVWSVSVYYKSKRTSYTRIPIQGQEIISFAYNKQDKYLYWADAKEQKIYRAFLDGSNKKILVNGQVFMPDGMIVDPVANQLYWTDATLGAIFRCLLDGSSKVAFVPSLDKPRALALHQSKKYLFWSSWGTVAKIERINTDGSNQKVLFQNGLVWPNGMVVDGSKLYWADAKLDRIEMSDLEGRGRVLITRKGVVHPFGLAITGSRLFWTDWAGDIRMFDKSKAALPVAIVTGIQKPFDLEIYDGTATVKASFCSDPGVPTHGGRNPLPRSGGKYKVGDRIALTCNPGFVHLGSNLRECLSTGKWTGTDTKCKARPVFTLVPSNKTVDSTSSVTLECSAETRPGVKAKIQWYKNGKILPPSSSGRYFQLLPSGFLFFTNIVDADTGTYTCVATDDTVEARTSMFLLVRRRIVNDCGKAKFKQRERIIGGRRATPGSIPWQVLLWNKRTRKPFCGGSLLNSRWVITAAHCLLHFQVSHIRVILGEYDWRMDEKTEQRMNVAAIDLHPNYDPVTYDSDIALIKLKTKAIMTDYIKPVCLPTSGPDLALLKPNNIGRISGWGARKNNNKSRSVKKLHTVQVPVSTDAACRRSHPTYHVTSNMFCAGRADGRGDACRGDSGGPLTMKNKKTGRTVLIGIVSWGVSGQCGVKNKYGVYTKVQKYLTWINNKIKHD